MSAASVAVGVSRIVLTCACYCAVWLADTQSQREKIQQFKSFTDETYRIDTTSITASPVLLSQLALLRHSSLLLSLSLSVSVTRLLDLVLHYSFLSM
jgi:hypothetical protein